MAQKPDKSYQYKDDATWMIKPALAKVEYINIDFKEESAESVKVNDVKIKSASYYNKEDQPKIESFHH